MLVFPSLFILLYIAHLIADYPCQTDHQAQHKADPGINGWAANLSHAVTHVFFSGVFVCLGHTFLDLGFSSWEAAGILVWVAVTHSFIDRRWPVAWWMRKARQEGFAEHGGAHHVDQTAHLLALGIGSFVVAVI